MDRNKPPGQWDDGVREPRVVLSALPNSAVLGPFKRRAVDLATLDPRAANQVFDTSATPPGLKERRMNVPPVNHQPS